MNIFCEDYNDMHIHIHWNLALSCPKWTVRILFLKLSKIQYPWFPFSNSLVSFPSCFVEERRGDNKSGREIAREKLILAGRWEIFNCLWIRPRRSDSKRLSKNSRSSYLLQPLQSSQLQKPSLSATKMGFSSNITKNPLSISLFSFLICFSWFGFFYSLSTFYWVSLSHSSPFVADSAVFYFILFIFKCLLLWVVLISWNPFHF